MTFDQFEMSDAAYVLGALSAPERATFEAHLATCDACAARVEGLRDLPRLLAAAPPSEFSPQQAEVDPTPYPLPDNILPRLLRQTRRERTRRRLVTVTSLMVAAACLVTALTVLLSHRADNPYRAPPQARSMANIVDVPIHATAQVVTTDSWAQVNIWCTYDARAYSAGNYEAVARTKTGQRVPIGSWPGVPGQTAVIRTPTHLHTVDLAAIEIVSSSGRVLASMAI